MKNILGKLSELEATAPKAKQPLNQLEATSPRAKKLLNENGTSSVKAAKSSSLKDVFENLASGQKPMPVVGKQGDTQKTGAGFLNITDTSPTGQAMQKALGDLAAQGKAQIVMPTQPGQAPAPGQPAQAGQPAPAGATGQLQAGQQAMREDDDDLSALSVPELRAKAETAIRAKDNALIKKLTAEITGRIKEKTGKEFTSTPDSREKYRGELDRIKKLADPMSKEKDEEQLDELSPQLLNRASNVATKKANSAALQHGDEMRAKDGNWAQRNMSYADYTGPEAQKRQSQSEKFSQAADDKLGEGAKEWNDEMDQWALNKGRKNTGGKSSLERADDRDKDWALSHRKSDTVKEGAKVDRMVKHIEKSEREAGKSKDKASDIAWATANKRGMLDNKNKKKVKEADIPSSAGVDTRGAGLGAGRSATTLEGKPMSKKSKPDFLDMDKDGNKKEPMKKAVADKKKKAVKEGMNGRISAARHEGRADGLRGNINRFKQYDDLEEARAYHDGYKDGLDECYGQGVYEAAPAMPPATVGGMANQVLDELGPETLRSYANKSNQRWQELDTKSHPNYRGASGIAGDPNNLVPSASAQRVGARDIASGDYSTSMKTAPVVAPVNAEKRKRYQGITQAWNKLGNPTDIADPNAAPNARKGPYITKGDISQVRIPAREDSVFEAWDRELNNLLTENESVSEGLSVSISKGQQNAPDSVTITAQDAEADHLLALVKNAGLGLFGDDDSTESHSTAMSVSPSVGEPDEIGAGGIGIDVVDDADGMLALMKKLGGVETAGINDYSDEGEEDYSDEEAEAEHECNECGMMEAECGCSRDGQEQVDEVESEDQMEFEVSEDNAPDSGAEEEEEEIQDTAQANQSAAEEDATDTEDEEEDVAESYSFESIYKKIAMIAESDDEEDAADSDGEEDVTESDEEDDADSEEDLTEWANNAGKKGTDASFEQDIDFMTKIISGGLNKQKSTGQTTVPVIAGQDTRMSTPQSSPSEAVDDWKKLAGIK